MKTEIRLQHSGCGRLAVVLLFAACVTPAQPCALDWFTLSGGGMVCG